MDWNFHSILLFITLILLFQKAKSDFAKYKQCENCSTKVTDYESVHVLSRRKRYLTFPDGSSLQLVFCVQTTALIPIGEIFLYGNTAALAWNLPTSPEDFKELKDKALKRGDMKKELFFLNEDGKVIARTPYKRSKIVNPVFAKRSIKQNLTYKERLKIKIDRLRMHERQLNRDYLKTEHMDEKSIEFHRTSRIGLYGKIEKLLTALGHDGRQCVLRKLCEAARQREQVQGTFLQELLRVVFTLPKGREFAEELHRIYDKAHTDGECKKLYPGCKAVPLMKMMTKIPNDEE